MRVPLSEEEQRILQEMEQKLYEHDRAFVHRVNSNAHRLQTPRGARWAGVLVVAGLALLLGTFRFSVPLGALGFFMMLGGTLVVAQHIRQSGEGHERSSRSGRGPNLAEKSSEMRRRMRSRFGHRN
ncbi:MAG: DUF3040 domain-containing protein, partial [Acidimicrobiales bacterium]